MTDEKWNNLKGIVIDKFGIEDSGKEEIEDIPNAFNGPLGRMKIERKVIPIVIDKKTTYSARAGSAQKVDYIYSESEFSSKFRAYKWINGSWEEIEANMF